MKKCKLLSMMLVCVMLVTACGNNAGTTMQTSGTQEETAEDVTYESKIFDTSYVHEINVEISDDDWQDLRTNPLEKTKYSVNVTIDGEEVTNVSFATKGNTSLSSVASDEDSDRYSFKINFGKFVDNQTYYGLDKLNLNNIYADATYMKDYMSYYIFRQVGASAPLTSYTKLSINGEYFGLYLALEEVGSSLLDRTTNGEGALYKPETEELNQNGKGQEGGMPDGAPNEMNNTAAGSDDKQVENTSTSSENAAEKMQNMPEGKQSTDQSTDGQNAENTFRGNPNLPERPDGAGPGGQRPDGMSGDMLGKGMFGGNDSGASLKYTDDKLESYSDIFDNAETDVTEEDEQRVITALKQLSENTNLEEVLDTDSIIRYFVAHNFVMNYDSYTGSMLHNYYLYENNGKLSLVPWDYNLAFGTFMNQGGGGKENAAKNGEIPDGDTTGVNASDNNASDIAVPDKKAGTEDGSAVSTETVSDKKAVSENENTASAENVSDDRAFSNDGFSGDEPGMGGHSSADATTIVNYGIDTPLSGSSEEDRPMWNFIVSNQEYLQKYHEIYDELIANCFESGVFAKEMERVYNMLHEYVETDPSAFYTVDEFEKAYETLNSFCELRSESIRKQLSGELSVSTDEQEESAKVDASSITISDMGTQGGGEKGMEHRQKWQGSESSSSEAEKSQDMNSMKTEGMSGGDVPAEDTSVGDTTDR